MSATRKSDRKPKANTRLNDLAHSSPTQPKSLPISRKRKASGAHALPSRQRRQRRPKTPEELNAETEPEEEEDDEKDGTDDEDSQELVDLIIPFLDVNPNEPVLAADQHANSKVTENGKKEIEAYAKICGREWTYYVRKPRITFGREPDEIGGSSLNNPSETVDVDLGPSKTVSRKHAQLYFDPSEDKWRVVVLGRNGVKINDGQMKKNEDRAIHSGDVLGIAGTQMLFQAASGKATIHPMFVDKMLGPDKQTASDPGNGLANGQPSQLPINPAPDGMFQPQPSPYGPPQSTYGQMNIAPAPVSYPPRPVTPTTTPQKGQPSSTKKRSPGGQYRRAIMMESTETIDYAADSSRDLKPQCSYAAMITWAILSSPDEALSLSGIYDWIKKHYAYYRLVPSGWQNSIRHNLSLNPAFDKVARRSDEPGKGMKWCIVPEKRAETVAAAEKNASKGGGRTSSAPGSPAGAPMIGGGFPILNQAPPPIPNGTPIKFQQQQGPPLSTFPPSQPQQPPGTPTPPQGPATQLPIYAPTQGPSFPALSEQTSPLRERLSARLPPGLDSSPVFNSQSWHSGDYPAITPAPRVHNLGQLQPNTNSKPTSYVPQSSPAPFWKFTGDSGSTPMRGLPESSPVKANGGGGSMGAFPSSSPPPPANSVGAVGTESPTRKTGTSSRPVSSSKPPVALVPPTAQAVNGEHKHEEEDGAIDLAKGFKPIGKFHEQRMASAANVAS